MPRQKSADGYNRVNRELVTEFQRSFAMYLNPDDECSHEWWNYPEPGNILPQDISESAATTCIKLRAGIDVNSNERPDYRSIESMLHGTLKRMVGSRMEKAMLDLGFESEEIKTLRAEMRTDPQNMYRLAEEAINRQADADSPDKAKALSAALAYDRIHAKTTQEVCEAAEDALRHAKRCLLDRINEQAKR